ncbi:uncharacterized protein LOC142226711 isoform X2 [Haematobia irritans]
MLKEWLVRRRENPYPSREEKKRLAIDTGLTYTQICNWFANWRRKLKNAEREKSKKSWGHLIKNYNTNAKGNVEQFSISSEDSIWEEEEQFRRNRSDDEDEDDSMCDIEGSSGSIDTNTERNDGSTIKAANGDCRQPQNTLKIEYKSNVYIDGNLMIPKDHNDLFIGREVDVLTTNATCQIKQSAANVGTKTKYKQKIMEKYLRDTFDANGAPMPPSTTTTFIQTYRPDGQNHPDHATVYCNNSNATTIIKSGAELSKWLESAAKFTPNKNNYYIEWNNKRNKSDKKPCISKSFPSHPGVEQQQATSLTVVPLLYSTTPLVQIQKTQNNPQFQQHHHQQQQQQSQSHSIDSDHIYNSIHHKDELDAAEALANLAFNCRQRMMDSNVNARVTFHRPLNAMSS